MILVRSYMIYKISRDDLIFLLKKEIKHNNLIFKSNIRGTLKAKEVLTLINKQDKLIKFFEIEILYTVVNISYGSEASTAYEWPGYKQALIIDDL